MRTPPALAKYDKLKILISSGVCIDLLDERALVLVRANHRNSSHKYTNALERITNKILDKMKNVVTLIDAGEMSLVKSKWPELASFPD